MPPASRRRRLTGGPSVVTAAVGRALCARPDRPSRWRRILSTPLLVLASTVISDERRHCGKVSRASHKLLVLNTPLTDRSLEPRVRGQRARGEAAQGGEGQGWAARAGRGRARGAQA